MKVDTEYRKRLERVLADHGIAAFRYVQQRKHLSLEFEHGGRTLRKTIPSSPSDSFHGPVRAAADLRRMLRGPG
jgi:hypothetical protein